MKPDYTTVCNYCLPRRGLRRDRSVAHVAAYTVAVKSSTVVRNCCPEHLPAAIADQLATHGEPALVVADLRRLAALDAAAAAGGAR